MSGGSLDYGQYKIDEIADNIMARATKPLHKAFAKHLHLVGQAVHDIEWLYSGDYGDGDEVDAIEKCLNNSKGQQIEILQEELKELIAQAEKLLE